MTLHTKLQTLYAATAFALISCGPLGVTGPPDGVTEPADPVVSIGISLGYPGIASYAFLSLGDRDTVRAQAYTGGWPSHTKYDSSSEPRRFQYSSTNPAVATVDLDGVVTTLSAGVTDLTAKGDGVTSPLLRLEISPPATSFAANPATVSTRVGDTFTISIEALDLNGQSVPGVIFNVAPDTTHWALTSTPLEGTWLLRTPMVLHLTAKAAGRLLITASVQNERAESRFQASVPVTIEMP